MSLTLMAPGIDTGIDNENGKVPESRYSPSALEPILKLWSWLADQGFKKDDDLLRLAQLRHPGSQLIPSTTKENRTWSS